MTVKNADAKTKANRPRFYRTTFGNTTSPETTAAAKEALELAIASAALGDSRFLHHMMMQFNHHIACTDLGGSPIDTMATMMFADGDNVFMYNPEFTTSLETTADVLFIALHEAQHKLLNHLRDSDERPKDQTWTYAQEIVINAINLARFKTGRMPHQVRVNKAGNKVAEATGVDPREVYHKTYLTQCQEAGLTPVSYDKFTESERTCYTELMRLPNPPGQGGNEVVITCGHQGDDDGDGQGGGSLSDELMDEAVKAAIQATVNDARNGSEDAKAEILKLAEATEDGNERAKKMWGDYGIMGLRGRTDATRKIEWWQQWLTNTLASKLVPGEKLIFPKKRSGMLLALGEDPIPVRRGLETQSKIAIFSDRSASMSEATTKNINTLVGNIPGAEVDFFDFDGIVKRHVLGEGVHGGGGTNFQNCVDAVEGRYPVDGELLDDEYDAVIMVTDGYAPHVTPAEPDKWIWLITDGGDEWPDTHNPPMDCHRVDTAEAAASV